MRTSEPKQKPAQQTEAQKSRTGETAPLTPINSVNTLLQLQRTIGNKAVARLLKSNASRLSPKSLAGGIVSRKTANGPIQDDQISEEILKPPFIHEPLQRAESWSQESNSSENEGQPGSPGKPKITYAPPMIHRQNRRGRPLEITTRTQFPAASGAPDTRRTIGVGEPIEFRANRRGEWQIDSEVSGTNRSFLRVWERPGRHNISLRNGSQEADVSIRVVTPNIRTRKLSEAAISLSRGIGVLMRLEFLLTPTSVSFMALQFREDDCDADSLWGYFNAHPDIVGRHSANPLAPGVPNWTIVNAQNKLAVPDNAGWLLRPSLMYWPLTAGGFRWSIPDLYRIGSNEYPLGRNMSQTFWFRPNPHPSHGRPGRLPFEGEVKMWKGGSVVEREYP